MAANSESWKWERNSLIHREKFMKLIKYGKENPQKVKEINGVRVCCIPEFCIGQGSDGTRVYIGLGNDGYERAVKRLHKDACTDLAELEKTILNEPNIKRANNVVRYYSLDDRSDDEYVFLILDLCEETLESYVKNESLDILVRNAPKIISHILKGLADLHRNQPSILHRDVKPFNILRNVHGEWLLADFGISRLLPIGARTYNSVQRGTIFWRAVETYGDSEDDQVRYKKESDIQVAGMVAYYVVTKGQHPFGEEAERLLNLREGKPVGLDSLSDPALKDFLSWMLSHDPYKRPSAEEALKHPYLQTAEEKFEMLCKVGNEVEIKKGDVNSVVVRQLNSDSTDWRTIIRADVLKYFVNGRNYGPSWTECLRLMRNVNQHWKDTPRPLPQPKAFYEVGDPQEYFLKVFPDLPVLVHRIVRSSDWKERPELQKYFRSQETDKECEETSGSDALYVSVHEVLTQLLNDNCEWSDLEKAVEKVQTNHNKVGVSLICLSKLIEYCIRKGDHTTAEEKLNEYNATLPNCTPSELDVFEVKELYLRCFMERWKGNYKKSYEIVKSSSNKAKNIQPGIVSTEFYALVATVVNILAMKTKDASARDHLLFQAKELFNKALRHLQNVRTSKFAKADLEQKLYTNLAMFHSGSCLAGYKLTDSNASVVDETVAKQNLHEINRIVSHQNIPLRGYREIQHHLAQSDLFYLASKSGGGRTNYLLKQALQFAKQAKNLAEVGNFPEMVLYAQVRVAVIPVETEPWKWEKSSLFHREKFAKLLEYGQENPEKVMEINGVRVCCLPEFCIGKGDDGTRVYVGLGKEGYERAVKRLPRDACSSLAEDEMRILNEHNIRHSSNVVRFWFFDDKSDKNYVFLILDLCEETLESYVDRKSSDDLAKIAPAIIRQVLKGLADLHRNPTPILHRDLKPSDILRNVRDEWLLANFYISRVLTAGELTYRSKPRGAITWTAVETYGESEDYQVVRYDKGSDIQVAGMVAYYVVTKGQNPYGKEIDRLRNLLYGNPVGLDSLLDPGLKDLLSWMLSHDPNDRPSAEEALKHPYLQRAEEKFEMLCKIGNEVEIKKGDVNSIVVRQLNSDSTDWRTKIRPDVLQYLCTDYLTGRTTKYGSSWTECFRLIRNVNLHWKGRPRPLPQPEAFYEVGDPQEYFLKVFPNLPVVVHRIVRSSDWKKRPELRKYFSGENDGTPETRNDAQNAENLLVPVEQEETDENEDARTKRKFLEEKFLDEEYTIKDQVHEIFKRFSWLRGAYGISGPNKNIPHLHFYVTVERGKPDLEVYQEIKAAFNLELHVDFEPKDYFELRKTEKEPEFQFLATPGCVGSIVAEGLEEARMTGTLTMFCCKDQRHYALASFHLGCMTDQCFQEGIKEKEMLRIRSSPDDSTQHVRKLRYYYNEREIGSPQENFVNYLPLDNVHNTSIDSASDIISIEVPNDVEIHCEMAETESPNWQENWRELHRRVTGVPKDRVHVEKDGHSTGKTHGHIAVCNYNHKHDGELLFTNAILVEDDGNEFLKPGDSGALVWFHDENGRKQAFAYGVAKVDELDQVGSDEDSERKGPYYICLKLNTGLRKLGLSNAGCFRECGGNN